MVPSVNLSFCIKKVKFQPQGPAVSINDKTAQKCGPRSNKDTGIHVGCQS